MDSAEDECTEVVSPAAENPSSSHMGCQHYKRKCKLLSPCCKKSYICRFCHDENESHRLDRVNLAEVICLMCNTQQPINKTCINANCGIAFGKYFCGKCKLFDDEDKQQYHCDGCGLCRVGGEQKFFHCDTCEMCLPKAIQFTHKCIEKMSQSNCPICLDDIHTSRIVSHVPPCGHLIHQPCFQQLVKSGYYACPTCGISMVEMKSLWDHLDEEIKETPMPKEYSDLHCNVLCRDCHKKSLTAFHVLGQKCIECGSYNTVRDKGGLLRKKAKMNDVTLDDEMEGAVGGIVEVEMEEILAEGEEQVEEDVPEVDEEEAEGEIATGIQDRK